MPLFGAILSYLYPLADGKGVEARTVSSEARSLKKMFLKLRD